MKSWLHDRLYANSLHNSNQSAYTRHRSTETTLLSLSNHLITAISHKQVSCFYLIDLSATFDTIEHSILFYRFSLGSASQILLLPGFNPTYCLALSVSWPLVLSHPLFCLSMAYLKDPFSAQFYTILQYTTNTS